MTGRRLLFAARNIFLGVAFAILCGATVQAVVEWRQRDQYPPPGMLVDVGDGRQLHLRVWGTDNDGPTLVLDVSANLFSSAFGWLGRMLGEEYRVVAYDRPGLGWSVGRREPRDARSAAEALSTALERAGIGPPYVVVAHSFGGFSGRLFADMHRPDLRAMVLLDNSHPDQGGSPYYGLYYRWRALLGHAGLYVVAPPASDLATLPAEEAEAAVAVSHWTSHLDASAEELEAWDVTVEQVRRAGGFDDLPLLVLAGPGNERHVALQRDLLRLSTDSRFVQLHHVGHVPMLTRREQAVDVVAEIRQFLQEALAD